MKLISTIKMAVLCLFLGLILGCSTTTQQFIFSPNYTLSHQKTVQNEVSLAVNDKRINQATVTINSSDGSQSFTDRYLADAITPALKQALSEIGASNSAAGKSLDINILMLKSNINQQLHKHSVNSSAELEVVIENTQHRFAKRYKGKQQSSAPFNYDKAKVEQQVNRLLEDMITRIVTDAEFINALNR